MIIGVSFALFTDTQTVTNHLRAGDLDITLNRIGLTKTVLNDQGYLDTVTLQTASDDPVPFSGDSRENVFGLLSGEKIVPGSKYQATMQIENNSDVAIKPANKPCF
jgi:predicted ribosomally synthesized peptide with SipW-like signal peptide